jgi:hypothetical protein
MPVCLRCKKLVNYSDADDWILFKPTIHVPSSHHPEVLVVPFIKKLDEGASAIRSSGIFPSDLDITGSYPYIGLCPVCQLSDAQIDNMRRD